MPIGRGSRRPEVWLFYRRQKLRPGWGGLRLSKTLRATSWVFTRFLLNRLLQKLRRKRPQRRLLRAADDNITVLMKPLAHYMEERGVNLDQLVAAAGLEPKLVHSIVSGNYTASPLQRQRLASAIGVPVDEIAWGHTVPVDHLWGHGPQFGRKP